jgi:hypothetical protein
MDKKRLVTGCRLQVNDKDKDEVGKDRQRRRVLTDHWRSFLGNWSLATGHWPLAALLS